MVTLAQWMNSWTALGVVVVGMTRQGSNVELRQYPDGWRANFYPPGIAHSIVVASGWAQRPGRRSKKDLQ